MAPIASIFKIEVFLLIVVKTMPRLLRGVISLPFNRQVKVTGRSPLLMTQETDAVSPSFKTSSPNSNGVICGGTKELLGTSELLQKGFKGFWGVLLSTDASKSGGFIKCTIDF